MTVSSTARCGSGRRLSRAALVGASGARHPRGLAQVAVGETVILLTLPLPSVL